MQTIIIVYYDIIIEKMIPGVFITINNKTEEGYLDCFLYLKYYIDKLIFINKKELLRFTTFTTDFEIALINAFNKVFNKEKNIRHIGCYFHYLQNIRKYMQKNGYTKKKYIEIYNTVMSLCKILPFKKIKNEDLIKYIEKSLNKYKNELESFISYFIETGIKYFNDESLSLNDVFIKFRTNNCLENFNKQLKYCFRNKKNVNILFYIDILKEEVIKHEEYLIEENKKSLKPISNIKLKGNTKDEDNYTSLKYLDIVYDNIMNLISSFEDEDNTDNKEETYIFEDKIDKNKEETFLFNIGQNEIINVDKENNFSLLNNKDESEIIERKNDLNYIIENKLKERKKNLNEILFKYEKEKFDNYDNNKNDIKVLNKNKNEKFNFSNFVSSLIRSLIGLNNLGDTCYMNSILQILIHTRQFVEDMIVIDSDNNIKPITTSLNSLFKNILIDKKEIIKGDNKSFISQYSYSPIEFKENFCKLYPAYESGQQDCLEFLRILFEVLSRENNKNYKITYYKELDTKDKSKSQLNKEYHQNFINRENSFIALYYYQQIINIFECKCGYKSYNFEKILDIPLLLPKSRNYFDLKDLIDNNFIEDNIDWIYKCIQCKQKNIIHIKKTKFTKLNNILIFNIQRLDRIKKVKNKSLLKFYEHIDLKKYCDDLMDDSNTKYKLYGIINHIGDINHGHYYANIKIDNFWYEFNDSSVKSLENINFESDEVCILFYNKC